MKFSHKTDIAGYPHSIWYKMCNTYARTFMLNTKCIHFAMRCLVRIKADVCVCVCSAVCALLCVASDEFRSHRGKLQCKYVFATVLLGYCVCLVPRDCLIMCDFSPANRTSVALNAFVCTAHREARGQHVQIHIVWHGKFHSCKME